ncbi:type II toxin-antitoxin system death-on-curing family toxin [Glycocaulis profundi]|nr:type II toxin-antitoxin system death-on-curing family toxin [Glycocaulis profundi]
MSVRLPDYDGFRDAVALILEDSTGTRFAYRDEALMQSAFARPSNLLAYDPQADAFAAAASMAYGVGRNHALVDGNKRAAAAALMITLMLNGWRLDASQRLVIDTFTALAEGALDEAGLAEWARANAVSDARFTP